MRFDGFSAFSPYFERSQAGYIIVRKGENLLVRLLNTNINDTNRGRRWFDEVFIVDSQQVGAHIPHEDAARRSYIA